MKVGVGFGTDGAALEIMLPATRYVQIRLGMDYMPSITFHSTEYLFSPVTDAEGGSTDASTVEGSTDGTITESKFEKIKNILEDLTQTEIDDQIDFKETTRFWNGKILVDVFPFKKQNWFFTAGIYLGPRNIVHVENAPEDMSTLIAVSTFNNIYNRVLNEEPVINYGDGLELDDQINQQILSVGKISLPIGTFRETTEDHNAGDVYEMVPDKNGMIRMDVISNLVRPYVGFGYQAAISKDKRSFFSFNAGILCWGNLKMITHDGVDLIRDVDVTSERLLKYTTIAGRMKVYPILNISFSRQIF